MIRITFQLNYTFLLDPVGIWLVHNVFFAPNGAETLHNVVAPLGRIGSTEVPDVQRQAGDRIIPRKKVKGSKS